MTFKTKVFINGTEVKSSELQQYNIQSKAVDRIVNDVFERVNNCESNIQKLAS